MHHAAELSENIFASRCCGSCGCNLDDVFCYSKAVSFLLKYEIKLLRVLSTTTTSPFFFLILADLSQPCQPHLFNISIGCYHRFCSCCRDAFFYVVQITEWVTIISVSFLFLGELFYCCFLDLINVVERWWEV